MKSRLIIIASIATASITFATEGHAPAGAQVSFAAPESADPQAIQPEPQAQPHLPFAEEKDVKQDGEKKTENESPLAYMFDVSKKSTRGYDVDGRQEVVNIGPGMKTTADGQTQSRTGPRGRQRGAVLPHKYIVRLKSGADFSSLDLHSRVAEHNPLIRVSPEGGQEEQEREQQEIIPNQVDHEYDFGTWKGYAGQFSSEFLKELESHDEIEYVEEDTMMWAWGMEDQQEPNQESSTNHDQESSNQAGGSLDAVMPSTLLGKTVALLNESLAFEADGVMRFEYLSLKAPSWGLTRISERQRDFRKDYSYVSTAGADVDIYIIDSGVFEDHKDFEGRAVNLANFVPGEEDTDTCGHVRVAVTKYGLPFFVAAGNTGDDACQYSPAGVEEAFAVGGSDRSDRVGWYSCIGSCVNIFAPGTGIASDWIRSPTSAHILDGTSTQRRALSVDCHPAIQKQPINKLEDLSDGNEILPQDEVRPSEEQEASVQKKKKIDPKKKVHRVGHH
ncbi:Suppressor of the cold-sensitive snRNP biogenesis mutant brr1-1 [Mortierella sp. AD094]|nr:Suppressor of the cold-sensitive snRNP biogenesis mutant brr1-1 [Mortierella sp. AD094]